MAPILDYNEQLVRISSIGADVSEDILSDNFSLPEWTAEIGIALASVAGVVALVAAYGNWIRVNR